jgi:hypothetical protein
MSIPATQQQSHSRDVALAAIAQAHRQIGHTVGQLAQVDETVLTSEKGKKATPYSPNEQPLSAEPGRGSLRGRLMLRSLMGLLAVACIGIAAFAWPSLRGQAALEPISTSSASTEKKRLAAQPLRANVDAAAKTDAGLAQSPSQVQAQATPQRAAPVAQTAAPIAPDLAQSIQKIARELENVEQGIDQLKTGQAQMAHDNGELAEHLKAAQEMTRHNADLAEDLKAAQAKIARDNVSFADQLRASQQQMANLAEQLKASQEQIARLVAASEQKQRPRTLAPSPIPIANSTRKPVPPSPHVRVQTQDPKHSPPQQQ